MVKDYKTFLAIYRPVGGIIRVVVVKEDHGWFAFFATDPDASVQRFSKRSPTGPPSNRTFTT